MGTIIVLLHVQETYTIYGQTAPKYKPSAQFCYMLQQPAQMMQTLLDSCLSPLNWATV